MFGGYLGSPSLHYGAVTLLWHSPERHNFFHLTIMRHQNIKMSIYKGDKNHWVMQLFCFLVPVRKILKNTVALDHPVLTGKGTKYPLFCPCMALVIYNQLSP